jgi:hypothetical protein
MTRRFPSKVALLVAAVTVLLLSGGGVAYAYWDAGGVGTGSGPAATTVAVTLSPGTPTATLYPGGQSTISLTVTNPNAATVHINTLVLDTTQGSSGFAVDSGHSGCALASLSYTSQSNGGTGWVIPSKVGAVNGTLAITLANSLAMSATAANACQGAVLTTYLAAG